MGLGVQIKKWKNALFGIPAKLCASGISEQDDESMVQKKSLAINLHLAYLFFLTIYLPYSFAAHTAQRRSQTFTLFQMFVAISYVVSIATLASYRCLKALRPLYYTIILFAVPIPYVCWVNQGCFTFSGTPFIPWSFVATVISLVLGNNLEYWLVLLLHLALPAVPLSIERYGYMNCQVSPSSGNEVVLTVLTLSIPSAIAFAVVHNLHRQNLFHKETAELKQLFAEKLLLNVLPSAVASELLLRLSSSAPINIYQSHSNVTVGFSDICGFSSMCLVVSAEVLVSTLNSIFSLFDILCQHHGVEKIKTIGDAYMFVGFPKGQSNASFSRIAIAVTDVAVGMLSVVGRFELQDCPVSIRVGLHSGPVVGGVIGCTKFSFDIWGPVVNMASRLQSHSEPSTIQVSMSTANLIRHKYDCVARGDLYLKGIGRHPVYVIQTSACPSTTAIPLEEAAFEEFGLPRLRSLAVLNEKRRHAIYPSLEHLSPGKSPRCFLSLNSLQQLPHRPMESINETTTTVDDSLQRSSMVETITPSLTAGDLAIIAQSDSAASFQDIAGQSCAYNPLIPQTQKGLLMPVTAIAETTNVSIVPLRQNKSRSNSSMFSAGGIPLSDTADTIGSHSSSGLNEVTESV